MLGVAGREAVWDRWALVALRRDTPSRRWRRTAQRFVLLSSTFFLLTSLPMAVFRLKQRFDAFAQFVTDVIYDRRDDPAASWFGSFLKLVSFGYERVILLRGWLYRHRVYRDQPLGCLVVVVGNLTVGGTGKTPVVEKFARSLASRGRKVAILSRGYKSKPEPLWSRWWRALTHRDRPPPRIVSDGQNVLLDSYSAGDEPYMLARNLPGVVVLVDKDRVHAGAFAIKRFGCDTLILDDGFQYLPLRGAVNLLLIDKRNPFGNESLLPRGILREPIAHMRRANYVFVTKSDGKPDAELLATIRQHHPKVDVIECAHAPKYLQSLDGSQRLELTALKGKRVTAFSGIAVPESFEALLREQGAEIVHTRRFLDHHRFEREEIDEVYTGSREALAEWVLTTEKDAVRLPGDLQPTLPTYFLRLEIEILSGDRNFGKAVDHICFGRRRAELAAQWDGAGAKPPQNSKSE